MRAEVVGGNPSAEQVAAIVAALSVIEAEREAEAAARASGESSTAQELRMWVEASRRSAQRAGFQRGPWRMSGRIARRSRT